MNTEVFKYLPHGVSGSQWVFRWDNLSSDKIVVGLYVNHTLVGLVSWTRQAGYNELVNIEIRPDYQRQHYGAKLLTIVMLDSFNQPENDGYVTLKTKTTGAEQFYHHLGGDRFRQQIIFHSWISQKVIRHYLPDGGQITW